MTYTAKCVGGPCDGQVITSEMPWIDVPVIRDIETRIHPAALPDQKTIIDHVRYELTRIYRHPNAAHVVVWAPQGVSVYDVTCKLIEGYEP